MAELTLAELAKRLEVAERELAEMRMNHPAAKKDWRSVVGMFEDDEFTRAWLAEIEA